MSTEASLDMEDDASSIDEDRDPNDMLDEFKDYDSEGSEDHAENGNEPKTVTVQQIPAASENHANSATKPRSAANQEFTAAVETGPTARTCAPAPLKVKAEPVTPQATQSPEPASNLQSLTQTSHRGPVEIENAYQVHDAAVKDESAVKEEDQPLSNIRSAPRTIDLTGDGDDDEPALIPAAKAAAIDLTRSDDEDGGWRDLTQEEDDPLFVPWKHQNKEDDNDSLPDLSHIRDHMNQEHAALMLDSDEAKKDIAVPDANGAALLDGGDVDHADSDSESDFSPEPPDPSAGGNLRKRKNKGKPTGPRAKTAREWHQRQNRKAKLVSLRGYAWKKKQLTSLRKNLKAFLKKHVARKPHKQKRKGFIDPAIFLSDDDSGAEDHQELDSADLEAHVNGVGGKGKFIEEFLARFPELDVHRCRTDWSDLKKKSRSFGYDRMQKRAGEDADRWHLKGMQCLLYNHQMMGSAWMIERECAVELPNGGIVADDMGAGKTVQTLTTIVGNPAEPDAEVKATLIIVPPSLKNQWWREMKKHTPKVTENSMVFERNRIDNSIGKLCSSTIVLATYSEVIKSLPMPDPDMIKKWEADKLNVTAETYKWIKKMLKQRKCGMLHQICWYRIVIDESHHIKNPITRLFRATNLLVAEHRWCLSGTPIMNNWAEFHPQLRFLKDPLTEKIPPKQFAAEFCVAQDESCRQALGIVLSDLILRRSIKDKVLDKPIVRLPPLSQDVANVKRYHPERLLYGAVQRKLMSFINQKFPEGDERNLLTSYLPQLTRLRQLIAHPHLIGRQIMIILGIEGMKELKKRLNTIKLIKKSKPLADSLRKHLDEWIKDFNHKCYKAKASRSYTCLKCGETDDDLVTIKKCQHTFCEMCIGDAETQISERGNDIIEWFLCPKCKKRFKQNDAQPAHEEAAPTKSYAEPKFRKGKDSRGFRPSLAANQISALRWLKSYDEGRSKGLFASAKLRGVVKQIQQWLKEAPADKIIVFTQFRMFAIMVGLALQKKGIGFIYYTGDMSTKDRDEAIEKIEDSEGVKVMICGLKVGGQGLNFQFSNRGMITDIWWNNSIDKQALGRYYRMGQEKKTVHFNRIVVTKTVDSKIINLQEDKRKAIVQIMQDKGFEADDVLQDILGYKDGEPDDDPDTSDDESGDEDGFDKF